ncbi:MAG: energy transducer TonB, partial [Lentisphaeria bacterium]
PIIDGFSRNELEIKTLSIEVFNLPEKEVEEETFQERNETSSVDNEIKIADFELISEQLSLPELDINLSFDAGQINFIKNGDNSLNFASQEQTVVNSNVGNFINKNLTNLVFELSEVDSNPILVSKVLPVYPFRARNRNITGEVVLQFEITKEGRPQNIVLIKEYPLGYKFEDAARKALEQWRFKPAKKNGKDVIVRREVSIIFKLEK